MIGLRSMMPGSPSHLLSDGWSFLLEEAEELNQGRTWWVENYQINPFVGFISGGWYDGSAFHLWSVSYPPPFPWT